MHPKSHDPASDKQNIQMKQKISDECDQLLKELEMDMKTMNTLNNNLVRNFKKNTSFSDSTVPSTQSHHANSALPCGRVRPTTNPLCNVKKLSNYSKQVFYINKVKMVELNDVHMTNDGNQKMFVENVPNLNNNNDNQNPFKTNLTSSNKLEPSNNQEYFDSLIKLIENAAKNLTE